MKNSLPSNRKFGFLFTAVFFLLSAYAYIKTGASFKVYLAIFISSVFFILSIKNSQLLTPMNKVWFLIGQSLGKISSPVVLGAIFFLLITPVALISRLFGRDELKLKSVKCTSYWVTPIGNSLDSKSFKNQF